VEGFRTMAERSTRAGLSGAKHSFLSGSSGCRPSRVHEKTCRFQAVAQVSERKTILTRGAQAMKSHQDAVTRLAEVPGLGVDSAQRIIAEAAARASTFPSVARRKAIGNKCLRRVLNHRAHPAVAKKAVIFRLPSALCCSA
jgi:hypothetical protein